MYKRQVYAVTYADDNDGQWVTRFDTLAPSDVHDSDAKLLLDGGIVSYHPDIQVYASREALESSKDEGGCSTAPAPALVGLWLGAAMAVRRRR